MLLCQPRALSLMEAHLECSRCFSAVTWLSANQMASLLTEYFKCSNSLVIVVCIAWINDCTLYFCWFTWAKMYTLHWEQFYVKHIFAHLCFHLQTHINPMIDLFWMILCEQDKCVDIIFSTVTPGTVFLIYGTHTCMIVQSYPCFWWGCRH